MLTTVELEVHSRTLGMPENEYIRRDLRGCISPLSTTLIVGTRIASCQGPSHHRKARFGIFEQTVQQIRKRVDIMFSLLTRYCEYNSLERNQGIFEINAPLFTSSTALGSKVGSNCYSYVG